MFLDLPAFLGIIFFSKYYMYTRQSRNASLKFKAPKKLVASKFRSKATAEKEEAVAVKPVSAKVLSFDDLKRQLTAWTENENIPGKFQAWFTQDAIAEHSDWRIISKKQGEHEVLTLDAPAKDMEVPEVVKTINEQLHKDHLRIFRKAIRQIWFRATGDGRYALLVQANCHGRNSAHGYKTFSDFVERSCPEIISCHQIQCQPDKTFDPAFKQSVRVDCKSSFGSDFMPLADTGFHMHVLDWAPRIKDAWLGLPARIKDAIHPAVGDKLFEFYSGCSYVSASLASYFTQVEALDCRESAMLSTRYNSKSLAEDKLRFHRSQLEAGFFAKFFAKEENEGRWTLYFNLPAGESLPSGVEQAAALSRPERILLQLSDLEIAAKEIRHFRREGYVLRKNIPLYLEPGSGKMELLMLFVPDRAGLLSQNSAQMHKSRNVQRPKERINTQKQGDIPYFVQSKPTFKQRKD